MNEPIKNFFAQAENARRVFFKPMNFADLEKRVLAANLWNLQAEVDPAAPIKFVPDWKAQGAAAVAQAELQRRAAKQAMFGIRFGQAQPLVPPMVYKPEGYDAKPSTQTEQSTPKNLADVMRVIENCQRAFESAEKRENAAEETARKLADERRDKQKRLSKAKQGAKRYVVQGVEGSILNRQLGTQHGPYIEPQQAEAYIGAFVQMIQQHEQAICDYENLLGTYFDPDETSDEYQVQGPIWESGETHSAFSTWIKDEAERRGFKYLGNGHYSITFGIDSDPRWIIKWGVAGQQDACYDWLRWAAMNQGMAGVPTIAALRKVKDSHGDGYYVCLMESCDKVNRYGSDPQGYAASDNRSENHRTRQLCDLSYYWGDSFGGKPNIADSASKFWLDPSNTLEQRAIVETLLSFLKYQNENGWSSCINDLHGANVMVSTAGRRIVITDPMSDESSSWDID